MAVGTWTRGYLDRHKLVLQTRFTVGVASAAHMESAKVLVLHGDMSSRLPTSETRTLAVFER